MHCLARWCDESTGARLAGDGRHLQSSSAYVHRFFKQPIEEIQRQQQVIARLALRLSMRSSNMAQQQDRVLPRSFGERLPSQRSTLNTRQIRHCFGLGRLLCTRVNSDCTAAPQT